MESRMVSIYGSVHPGIVCLTATRGIGVEVTGE